MTSFTLQATKRSVLGQKVRAQRRAGNVPATIYGKGKESQSISIPKKEFLEISKHAGSTQLVDVQVDGNTFTVLIHHVQTNPVSSEPLNVEFFQVNLKEKMESSVPLRVVGESPAVNDGKGTLLTLLQNVDVESYPQDIPEAIDVDVSSLTDVDMEITVSALKVPAGVTIITEPTIGVVKIGELVKEEPVAQAPTETTEGETTKGTEEIDGTSSEKSDSSSNESEE